jgi:hypothetical protein
VILTIAATPFAILSNYSQSYLILATLSIDGGIIV